MLSIRARNPPDTDIVSVLQKFKVSFNLLVSFFINSFFCYCINSVSPQTDIQSAQIKGPELIFVHKIRQKSRDLYAVFTVRFKNKWHI